MTVRRRELLAGTALALLGRHAHAGIIAGQLPWAPDAGSPPEPVRPGPWQFFSAQEAAAVEALAERIIPADPQTPGGREAGCAVFLDRQLAGAYGRAAGLYDRGPFQQGLEQQGPQSPLTPAQLYRSGLAALERYCREPVAPAGAAADNSAFAALASARQDALLAAMESGTLPLSGVDVRHFFETLLKDVQQGFFADPIYGGNRDMCAWKMIGFPGARYDYRDWVGRHNERYPRPPVSLLGRAAWTPRR